MHPRNPYRIPPDFKELALKYPEFRKHAKQVITVHLHGSTTSLVHPACSHFRLTNIHKEHAIV